MVCTRVTVDGIPPIICGPRPRRKPCRTPNCGHPGSFLCYWKVAEGKTCDAPICTYCATEVATDKHLCTQHLADYRKWKSRRGQP